MIKIWHESIWFIMMLRLIKDLCVWYITMYGLLYQTILKLSIQYTSIFIHIDIFQQNCRQLASVKGGSEFNWFHKLTRDHFNKAPHFTHIKCLQLGNVKLLCRSWIYVVLKVWIDNMLILYIDFYNYKYL